MKFHAQLKELKRLSLVSNDTQFSVKLITTENLKELSDIRADEIVEVEIKCDSSSQGWSSNLLSK